MPKNSQFVTSKSMKLEVKGHSGCQIDVVSENGGLYVYKSTADPKYLNRLALQAEKQQAAEKVQHQHIRVPKVYALERTDSATVIKMQYVYSKNFIEFFEQAGFEQVEYLIDALEQFIEYEISQCTLQKVDGKAFCDKFADVKAKCYDNPIYKGDKELFGLLNKAERLFAGLTELEIPVGLCHGDLTFSNILFNGNNYYLIDFLDSFVETPLQDIAKLRQDTAYRWSQLMYTKRFDEVRLHIVLNKIDQAIDMYFSSKYSWYNQYYHVMQMMNILRILPYAKEQKVVDYLKKIISGLLQQEKSEDVNQTQHQYGNRRSLIVPAAADKPEYENDLPYIFSLNSEGIMICLKSVMGLELDKFDHIYFTILKKHDDQFFISELLSLQFKRLGIKNAKVVVLDEPTRDQAETIYQTIQAENIQGRIFIKDADSYFQAEMTDTDGVAICPIESLDILTPKDKSYVAVDDMYYITNIIEKSVVGHYISAGGYLLDVAEFCHYYHQMRGFGRLYLSHIIYAMLLDKRTFRPMMVEEYKDWGTKGDWNRSGEG